ncbi:MAG: sulfotransferase family protein [Deltaproteobacteria bacterium]|nr:sulfotransferase family protein [Deltaproteobacteria bacterium]
MSRAILIVGMHRSGTSCLAGGLEEAGLALGEVITEAPHNAKGNRESRRIMALHDAILAHSGGSWDVPPAELRFTDEHRRARDEILRGYGGRDPFGFKDPRTLVTLPLWLEVLPAPAFVGSFRHPRQVVESLVRRNGGDPGRWLALWLDHALRLLRLHAARPFPLVRFDVPEERYAARVHEVAAELGLPHPERAAFFERSLRHHEGEGGEPLPAEVEAAFAALRERAGA